MPHSLTPHLVIDYIETYLGTGVDIDYTYNSIGVSVTKQTLLIS